MARQTERRTSRARLPGRARGQVDGAGAIAQGELLRLLRTRGFRLLQAADFLGVVSVLVLLNLVRFGDLTAGSYPLREYALAFLAVALTHLVIAYFGGLYEPELRLGSRPQLPRVAGLMLVSTLFVALGQQLLPELRFYVPRLTYPALPVLCSLVFAANRRLARTLRLSQDGMPRALLVGAPDDVNLARAHLDEEHAPAVVVGEAPSGHDLMARVHDAGATDVLLVSSQVLDEVYPEPLTTLERRGIGVLQRVTARDTLLGLQGVREIAGMPFVALRTHTLPVSRARFKRLLELCGLVLVSPGVLLCGLLLALYIRIVAGAPVLYRQERVGQDGVTFSMLKFRTMYRDAEQHGHPILAAPDDPRIVPACRWLRATRLDELPQLWNVLRGEMSIVGPRPERPELTAQYEQLIPGYSRRHELPPGITGLAQIHGRYHTDPEYKLGHDLQYLVNWSPVLDLQIIIRTVWVMLARRS
jgi:exopolysaccharide biosynthesis polyprenyl glycosylphosphotransferase